MGLKAVTVEKGTAVTKTYDGTPDAMAAVSADNYVLNGIEGGDDVQLTYQGAEFNEAGTEAAYVTLTGLGLTGKDASKYILIQRYSHIRWEYQQIYLDAG